MGAVTVIRPMELEDVGACEAVWHDAYRAMRRAYHLPVGRLTDAERTRQQRHIALARDSDPRGSWVAVAGGEVVGFTQALRRDLLWVLSMLAVSVAHQGRAVASRLLERALGYGDAGGPGLIMSSRDPRAMHRYVQAGFALHPVVSARGVIRRSGLIPAPDVRPGGPDDAALVERLDRCVRGGAHGPELALMMREGCRLLVVPDRGYALARPSGIALLVADDDGAARRLLSAGMAATPEGARVEVNWITGSQQWAIGLCTDLGLELHPGGAVMVRGTPGPLTPYVPSGAFA
jgi:GNAT superfamily N-acetyltransferase